MKEALLDTHALIWLIQDNEKLDKKIRDDIEYFNGGFSVNVISILEMLNLIQLNKLKLGISLNQFFSKLNEYNILYKGLFEKEMLVLEKLPMLTFNNKIHSDVFDRSLIASAIANKMRLISADRKFPAYRKYGLDLIEINA